MIVKRRKLSIWERLYLPAIIGGFKVTLRHFFKKKVTLPDRKIRTDNVGGSAPVRLIPTPY